MPTMQLRDVVRRFGATEVLRGISLDVPDGSFTSLLGPSGCGKSTTLRIIAGLDRPDAGQVLMDGHDVSELTAAERNVAMVFQSYALYPHLTVAQNIGLPLAMRDMSRLERTPFLTRVLPSARRKRAAIEARVRAMAEMLDLSPLLERKPAQLSGGQQQRVSVGRALIREPSLFLLDEPLSNLDAKLRIQMRSELAALHRRTGRSFVYVTHDQAEAIGMSDRVALMLNGEIAQVGPPRELYETPATRDVAAFLGQHPINLLHISLQRGGVSGPFAAFRPVGAGTPGAAVLGLRPEHLRPDPKGPVHGRLTAVEFLGAETLLQLEVEGAGTVRAIAPGEYVPPPPGGLVRLAFDPERAHLFDAGTGARMSLALERGAA
jgi:multiple sugar transport system ATP-binding protein